MSLAQVLAEFQSSVAQCDSLIGNAHQLDSSGRAILPPIDQKQVTVAAFLNLYIAWETFLESAMTELMVGSPTLSGRAPVRFVSPTSLDAARSLVIGVQKYFDYGNCDFVLKMVRLYFDGGYPFEPHLSGIAVDLSDLRTMRNASAHLSSTTRTALESLAFRVLGRNAAGIDLYGLLMAYHPLSATGDTIFWTYKSTLVTAAQLIVQG